MSKTPRRRRKQKNGTGADTISRAARRGRYREERALFAPEGTGTWEGRKKLRDSTFRKLTIERARTDGRRGGLRDRRTPKYVGQLQRNRRRRNCGLAKGKAVAEARVAEALFVKAVAGDIGAIRWWEMTRANRSEKSHVFGELAATTGVLRVPHTDTVEAWAERCAARAAQREAHQRENHTPNK